MVKYIKIGRFAVAYDNTQPNDRSNTAAKVPPPPPPSPPPKAAVGGSGWATFGKFMLGLLGLFVVLLFIGSLASPTDQTESASAATASSGADPATPLGVCQRADVQDLIGKEAWRIILDQSRGRIVSLAIFGLVDPNAMLEQFENANVTFTGARAGPSFENWVACSGSMRFDASNTNTGQEIVQLPTLSWVVNFADSDGDLTSTNFTVVVDQASVFEGMLLNGKPAEEYADSHDTTGEGSTREGDDEDSGADDALRAADAAMKDANAAADEAQATVDDAAKAEAQLDASEKPKASRSPSDDDLYAPH